MLGNRKTHPSYGMLCFHRVSGGDPNLFGSSVKHNQKIQLTLKEGHVCRELNNDWYGGDRTLFEVEMSYTQFAELISAMNVGDGVPVTIRYRFDDGLIQGAPIVDKRTQFLGEFTENNRQSVESAQELIETLTKLFEEKRPLKAKEREDVLSALKSLSMMISSHNEFILSQFNEATEKITTEAKGEVEAFVQNKLNSIALAALAEKENLQSLEQNAPTFIGELGDADFDVDPDPD